MKIDSIKIIGGFDKSGARESVEEVVFRMGDIASIGYRPAAARRPSLTILSFLPMGILLLGESC